MVRAIDFRYDGRKVSLVSSWLEMLGNIFEFSGE
jgi:hypothetical protein